MNTWLSYFSVFLVIIISLYILVKQIKRTINLTRDTAYQKSRILLIKNYLLSFSMFGFIISFTLNFLIYLELIKVNKLTNNNTSLLCFIFLFIILVIQYTFRVGDANVSQTKYLKF